MLASAVPVEQDADSGGSRRALGEAGAIQPGKVSPRRFKIPARTRKWRLRIYLF
jgi:hypothetical protein